MICVALTVTAEAVTYNFIHLAGHEHQHDPPTIPATSAAFPFFKP